MTYEEARELIQEHLDYGGSLDSHGLAVAMSSPAAGASEGQAEPIYQARMGFYNWMDIDKERYDNFTLNGHPDNYRIVYTRPLLEIKTMSMTVEEALQRAADLEKQGCITPTAQALLALAKAYQDTMKDKLPKA